jgi:hypothetical protein
LPKHTPGWIDDLASQISAARGIAISAAALYLQFIDFRDHCDDRILKQSYPHDIHHFKRSRHPQASTRDIILSFMDKCYRELTVPMVGELATLLDNAANKRRFSSEFEKVLMKERLRRYANGKKRADSYWGINHRRVEDKYIGFYMLLRVDSGDKLRAEPFAISIKQRDPTIVSIYWLCDERTRVGDLFVNSYRFSALTVWKSTDAVIEPVSISLLRAPHRRHAGRKLPVVMGGFAVGWKDDDNTALFHSRIALIKLDVKFAAIRNYSEFSLAIQRADVADMRAALLKSSAVTGDLREKFLTMPDLAISPTDASDALKSIEEKAISMRPS